MHGAGAGWQGMGEALGLAFAGHVMAMNSFQAKIAAWLGSAGLAMSFGGVGLEGDGRRGRRLGQHFAAGRDDPGQSGRSQQDGGRNVPDRPNGRAPTIHDLPCSPKLYG